MKLAAQTPEPRKRVAMRILAIVALLLCAGRVAAQDVTESDRFQLFNECRPMYLLALVNPAVGNQDAIETLVRRRLRAARLYSERLGGDTAFLEVVYGFGRNTPVRLSYVKHLYDPVSETYGRAPTWRSPPDTGLRACASAPIRHPRPLHSRVPACERIGMLSVRTTDLIALTELESTLRRWPGWCPAGSA